MSAFNWFGRHALGNLHRNVSSYFHHRKQICLEANLCVVKRKIVNHAELSGILIQKARYQALTNKISTAPTIYMAEAALVPR